MLWSRRHGGTKPVQRIVSVVTAESYFSHPVIVDV